jgi:transposase InsO family protein
MPRGKKELAEQIIPKLREVEVEVGRGKTVLEAVKKFGVTEQTCYRWKKKFGGLRIAQAKRRRAVEHVRGALGRDRLSERRACRVLEQHRNTQRRRLWLNDGSCIRLRPTHRNHVWSYDFVADRTSDGRPIRMLTIVDEFTRECLAIDVAKRLTSEDVLERLSDLFVHRGVPEHIRSDNGSEFTAKCVREWLGRVGVTTLFIEPGSPWENGYVESFFRVAPGRAAGAGSVRHAPRGQGAHRAVAAGLQHGPAAQHPGVPTPGS